MTTNRRHWWFNHHRSNPSCISSGHLPVAIENENIEEQKKLRQTRLLKHVFTHKRLNERQKSFANDFYFPINKYSRIKLVKNYLRLWQLANASWSTILVPSWGRVVAAVAGIEQAGWVVHLVVAVVVTNPSSSCIWARGPGAPLIWKWTNFMIKAKVWWILANM